MIEKVALYKYSLTLKSPLKLKNVTLEKRDGLLIKIRVHNQDGWGEIAPLPGFSRESMSDAINAVKTLASQLHGKDIPPDILSRSEMLPPSVQFGFQTAMLNATASAKQLPLIHLLDPVATQPVKLNALLTGSPDAILNQAVQKFKDGYRTCKLKIGRLPVPDEIELIRQLHTFISPFGSIRLDANRSFSYVTAEKFINATARFNIEYIEEPFQSEQDLADYLKKTDSRYLALDETLYHNSFADIEQKFDLSKVKAFILKPTMLGFTKTMQLAKIANEKKIKPVISSSFESSFGIYTLAVMGAVIDPEISIGLDTLTFFAADIVNPPLDFSGGQYDYLRDVGIASCLNLEQLEEIPLA